MIDEDCILVLFNVFSSFDITVILCKHLSLFDIIVILCKDLLCFLFIRYNSDIV